MTSAASTIIAYVITTDLKHKIVPFVIRSDLTDHYVIVCSIKNRGGHLRRNNCGAIISLAIALAPQLILKRLR